MQTPIFKSTHRLHHSPNSPVLAWNLERFALGIRESGERWGVRLYHNIQYAESHIQHSVIKTPFWSSLEKICLES